MYEIGGHWQKTGEKMGLRLLRRPGRDRPYLLLVAGILYQVYFTCSIFSLNFI